MPFILVRTHPCGSRMFCSHTITFGFMVEVSNIFILIFMSFGFGVISGGRAHGNEIDSSYPKLSFWFSSFSIREYYNRREFLVVFREVYVRAVQRTIYRKQRNWRVIFSGHHMLNTPYTALKGISIQENRWYVFACLALSGLDDKLRGWVIIRVYEQNWLSSLRIAPNLSIPE